MTAQIDSQYYRKISVKSYSHYNNSQSVTISYDLTADKKLMMQSVKSKIADMLLDLSNTTLEYI